MCAVLTAACRWFSRLLPVRRCRAYPNHAPLHSMQCYHQTTAPWLHNTLPNTTSHMKRVVMAVAVAGISDELPDVLAAGVSVPYIYIVGHLYDTPLHRTQSCTDM